MKRAREFQFTIIAGTLKGRKITAPDLGHTRPPLSRLRKAIFDFLRPYLPEARYLDLYSGTGSYLFEAVSRGAGKATGVEREAALATAINKQAERFGIAGQLHCRCDDVFAVIEELQQKGRTFDIIMMAPPQYQDLVSKTLHAMRDKQLTTAGGLIVCQHDTSETDSIDTAGFEVLQRRKYGNTTFTVLRHAV